MPPAGVQSAVRSFPAVDLLGGARVLVSTPRSPLDWVAMIRRGLPSSAVDALTSSTHLSKSELAAAVGIPERTLARRKREGRLTREESSRLVRLARVVARGEEVFEDLGAAVDLAIPADIPQDLEIERMDVARLPPDWRDPAALENLRTIGGDWAVALTTAVLAVPSAVIPSETNFLLNPRHPDFDRIVIGQPDQLVTDLRLMPSP
jgi:putative toxin-antitoxin system antitoxin component (TIGR02293 family)